MKSLIIKTLCLLCLAVPLWAQQDAYNDYVSRANTAMVANDFKKAKDIFKNGKKYFKKQKNKPLEKDLDLLEDKAKKLAKALEKYNNGQGHFAKKDFYKARRDIMSGTREIEKAKKDYHKATVAHEDRLLAMLKAFEEENETGRIAHKESLLSMVENNLNKNNYTMANSLMEEVNKLHVKTDPHDLKTYNRTISSGMNLERGDRLLEREKYYEAIQAYNSIKLPNFKGMAASNLAIAKEKYCSAKDIPIDKIAYHTPSDFKKVIRRLKEAQCASDVQKRYKTLAQVVKAVKDADKIAATQAAKAKEVYLDAYQKTGKQEYKTKADKIK